MAWEPSRRFECVVVLGLTHVLWWTVQSALPVVFPPFARWKGLNTSQYASIFGFYGLARLVTGYFDNDLLSVGRPKFYIVNGIFLLGGTTLLHGVLNWCPGNDPFYLLSFLLLSLDGVAVAFIQNSSLLVLDLAFPTHALYYVAVLDSFSLAGILSGPIFTLIIQMSNYATPFLLVGVLLMGVSLLAQVGLVDERPAFEWCSWDDTRDLFRVPVVKWAQVIALVSAVADAFLLVTLTGHAQQFELGPLRVSALYLLNYVCYGATYFLIKMITNQNTGMRIICKQGDLLFSGLGCFVCALGFFLIGPSSFLIMKPTVLMLSVGLVLRGLGHGCLTSCAFSIVLKASRKQLRLPYDTQTYALVTRMTSLPANAGLTIGAFACCTLGSGYSSMGLASSAFFVIFITVGVCSCVFHWHVRRQTSLSAESTPLCDCSLRVGVSFPSSPTDFLPSDEDWHWLIQEKDNEQRHQQPSL